MSGGEKIYEYFTKIADGKKILEIGTLDGGSAIAFLKGNPELVVTVDNFSMAGIEHFKRDVSFHTAYENLKEHKNCWMLIGNSSEVLDMIADCYFDILFIDGDHSYEGVKRDFESGLRLVKQDGLILFHDYRADAFGVKKFVDEFGCPFELIDILAIVKKENIK